MTTAMKRTEPTGADYRWLAVILILAAALRGVGLDAPLWFDEIVTIDSHVRLPWSELMQGYSMNSHYLFSLQSKLAAVVFGDAIWAYRLPAAVFGVATVAAVWWLARDVAGPVVAHLSGLLIAISYHQVWFSQNARGYTELAFWSTLAMILFLRGLRSPGPWIWLIWGGTLAAAVFTHLTGAFFFLAQGLVWLAFVAVMTVRRRLRPGHVGYPLLGAAVGAGLTALLYAPLLPDMLATIGGVSESSAVDVMQEYQNPLWTVVEGVRTAIGGAGPLPLLVAVAVLAAAAFGTFHTNARAPLFAPVVLVHVALTVGLLLALGMRIWPRFFFVDIGLVMILIVAGAAAFATAVARMSGRTGLAGTLFATAAIAMVLVSGALLVRNYTAPKQNLTGAFTLVEATRHEDDRVYALGHVGPLFQGHFGADWGHLETSDDYAQAIAEPGPVILVVVFPSRTFRAFPALDEDTARDFTLVRRFPGTLGDGTVLVFRRDGKG